MVISTDYGQHWSCYITSKFEIESAHYPPWSYIQAIKGICDVSKDLRRKSIKWGLNVNG